MGERLRASRGDEKAYKLATMGHLTAVPLQTRPNLPSMHIPISAIVRR
jgi:hypothetical protein